MKSMAITDEEKKENKVESVLDTPDYPYGLELSLNRDTYRKLGFQKPPVIGQEFYVMAKAHVKDVSKTVEHGADSYSCSLQITEMDLKEKKEDKEKSDSNKSTILYGQE